MAGMKKKAAAAPKTVADVRASRLRRQEAFDKLPIEEQRKINNERKAAIAKVRARAGK